ncbi:uncharacterized protein LOC116001098 [Ipomoea triloba]|uniref:uncharacterized protein LOC116001098 n=1 Tax=Ipomoea triloba TaxID=35885 RepID=UPI00125D5E16|nr:uncharacterized protein LOC116001098 [Ipomoea triloba]
MIENRRRQTGEGRSRQKSLPVLFRIEMDVVRHWRMKIQNKNLGCEIDSESWVGLLQFGLSLHYLASLSTKRFSVNSNRRYAEKGKKPPPPEVLPVPGRICRRRRIRFRLMLFLLQFRFQREFKQDALRLYGNLVQIEKVQKGIEM